jgi:hypothetical protein
MTQQQQEHRDEDFVERLYDRFLGKTGGDKGAAAMLTLAFAVRISAFGTPALLMNVLNRSALAKGESAKQG